MNFFDKTLEDYRAYLGNFTESKNTLKNYVSDVRIFLTFLNSRYPPLNIDTISSLLTTHTISESFPHNFYKLDGFLYYHLQTD